MSKHNAGRRPQHFILGLILVVTGCQTSSQHTQLTRDLAGINLAEFTRTNDIPILDVHTHTFNGRDLPLEGIALGRRDSAPPWTWLITDDTAKFLAGVMVADTRRESDIDPWPHPNQARAQRVEALTKTLDIKQTPLATLTNRAEYRVTAKARAFRKHDTLPSLSLGEAMALRAVDGFFDHRQSGFRPVGRDLLERLSPFLGDLILSDAELLDQFGKENATNVQFRISHMMDMGPTYDQRPGHAGLRSFEKEIEHMAELQRRTNAHLAYFVAYNPFRDNSRAGEALGLVQRAISNHWAYGVKLYPPAGYRPISNSIPSRPRYRLTSRPGRQWDARYLNHGAPLPNAELDARLLELLRWCATNDIPVFAHAGHGEFQARKGYGQDMPDPRWWGELLTNAGALYPEIRQLRLCLGHSGGADSFFGDTAFRSWSEQVSELCRRFSNVYCEVGCQDQILVTNKQAMFAQEMERLCNLSTDDLHPYNFGSKIMYGSDWYMPIQGGDRRDFLARYQQVFLLPQLRRFYEGFFLTNALKYLNAEERTGEHPRFPLNAQVQQQLADLLKKAPPPVSAPK